MMNIGSIIYSNIGDLVDTHCYPLIAEQSTELPFIIYRSSSTANSSKDGIFEWEHDIEINIVDDEYDSTCELTENVIRRVLSMEENHPVTEVVIDSINEDFIENTYVKVVRCRLYTEEN